MKKSLLLATALLCAGSSFAQDMTIAPDGEDVKRKVDPATYADFGEFQLKNRWMISRYTDGDDEFLKYLPDNTMACSVVMDTIVYVSRPGNGSLLKFGLATGHYLGELKLTVDGESIGTGIDKSYNFTKDNFGHIVFHGYRATVGLSDDGTDSGLSLYYIEDLETGACKHAGDLMVTIDEYTNNYLKGRVDFSSIVGDVTRQEAHAIVMAGGGANAGTQIYRWKCEQGSDQWLGDFADKDGAGAGDVIMLAPVAIDGNATAWNGATVCSIVKDEDYSAGLFYIDGMNTQPALYDTNGNFVEGGTHTTEIVTNEETGVQETKAVRNVTGEWLVTEVSVNGIAEFTVDGTNFVCYANTQHGKAPGGDVKIAKLGDGFEWTAEAGAAMAWASVPQGGMGMTSDGGRRILNIDPTVVVDANGKEGVYLMINRNFNGIGLYTIAKADWVDPNGTVVGGIEGIEIDEVDGPAKYYNLQGVEVANPENGLYIVKRGNKVSKEVVVK